MNEAEKVLHNIFDIIELPMKQKKYMWRKLVLDTKGCQAYFLKLGSQIFRTANERIIK